MSIRCAGVFASVAMLGTVLAASSFRLEAADQAVCDSKGRVANLNFTLKDIVSRRPAAPAIVPAERDVPTELVVVGTRGRTNLSRLLLRSVAATVLRTAPCSVLVVHLAP